MFPNTFGHDVLRAYLLAGALTDIYFLPTLIAAFKRRSDLLHIIVVNVLTSWTIIGWVIALIMAVAEDDGRPSYRGRYREPPGPAGPPASAHPASQWLYQQQQHEAPAPPVPYPDPYDYPGYDS
ncbi:MAG TPA: superinfection immunity protein [Actinomycetota bacterium]|nr:superinfection immunity protein [Actinomycetota bacterium]